MAKTAEKVETPAPKWMPKNIEMRPITSLTPYAGNAREHGVEQVENICRSMEEFGWTVPVLVDPDGMIIAGHGRVLAADRMGYSQIPVIVADDWTDEQRRAYTIADNQLVLNGDWNEVILSSELAALDEAGFSLDVIGLSTEKVQELLDTYDRAGEFLDDLAGKEVDSAVDADMERSVVSLTFNVTPAERDEIMNWLSGERDGRKLKTTSQALLALCREAMD